MRQSSPSYGATPPYEAAHVFTLRAQSPEAGFAQHAVHVVGPVAGGTLYEWRRRAEPEAVANVAARRVANVSANQARPTATPTDTDEQPATNVDHRIAPRHNSPTVQL